MIYFFIIGIPCLLGLIALMISQDHWRPWLLPFGCALNLSAVISCWKTPPAFLNGWLGLDELSLIVITLVAVIFLISSIYCLEYLRLRRDRHNRLFTACLFFTLAALNLVSMSRHMGLLWIGMEMTTLATAPLIYFNRNEKSLEATWKYLMMSSLGIGFALLGTFFLSASTLSLPFKGNALSLDTLLAQGPALSAQWLKGAFILLLVGYGTKMGLSPLHFWKPDAYGESPGVVGAILSGAVISAPFLGILRAFQICSCAGLGDFCRELWLLMGLLSMGTAAVFIIRQRDFKRMLAYSSVEHMGILALGAGLGPLGLWAALLHLINNGLTKGLLFLSAGNIHRAFGGKTMEHAKGALKRAPISAALFLLGFFAIAGIPPFSPFISEFSILRAALGSNHLLIALSFIGLLSLIFIGMANTVLAVVYGVPPDDRHSSLPEKAERFPFMLAAPIIFLVLIIFLGLWIPHWLSRSLLHAAQILNGEKA